MRHTNSLWVILCLIASRIIRLPFAHLCTGLAAADRVAATGAIRDVVLIYPTNPSRSRRAQCNL
jgi:hypothetical protein